MIKLVKTILPPNVVPVESWEMDSKKIVVGIYSNQAYILTHEGNKGYIFRNVRNQEYGANGYRYNPKDLIIGFLNISSTAEAYVFEGIYPAIQFIEQKIGKAALTLTSKE